MYSLKKYPLLFLMTTLMITCNAFGKHSGNYESGGEVESTVSANSFDKTSSRLAAEQSFGLSNFGQRSSGGYHSDGSQPKNSGIKTSPRESSRTQSPISIAVQTRRTVEVIPVRLEEVNNEPQIIEITSSSIPLQLNFRSQSSRLTVHQSHTPSSPRQVEQSSSEDEPYRLVHEVIKPVIQEVREIIQPYRNVVQQIRPVIEHVNTVISKGEERSHPDSDHFSTPIRNTVDSGTHKSPILNSDRSSSNFDSVFSHKNIDSDNHQKPIDTDISQAHNYGSTDSNYGFAASNGIIYRIDPKINSRSSNLDNYHTSNDNKQTTDLSRRYFSVYPVLRFLE